MTGEEGTKVVVVANLNESSQHTGNNNYNAVAAAATEGSTANNNNNNNNNGQSSSSSSTSSTNLLLIEPVVSSASVAESPNNNNNLFLKDTSPVKSPAVLNTAAGGEVEVKRSNGRKDSSASVHEEVGDHQHHHQHNSLSEQELAEAPKERLLQLYTDLTQQINKLKSKLFFLNSWG
jgi:hypothetical protein